MRYKLFHKTIFIVLTFFFTLLLVYLLASRTKLDNDEKDYMALVDYVSNTKTFSKELNQGEFEKNVLLLMRLIDRYPDKTISYFSVTIIFDEYLRLYIDRNNIAPAEPFIIMRDHFKSMNKEKELNNSLSFQILISEASKFDKHGNSENGDSMTIGILNSISYDKKYRALCEVLKLKCYSESNSIEYINNSDEGQDLLRKKMYESALGKMLSSSQYGQDYLFIAKMIDLHHKIAENINNKNECEKILNEWFGLAISRKIDTCSKYEDPYSTYEAVAAANLMINRKEKFDALSILKDKLNDVNDAAYKGYRSFVYLELARIYYRQKDYKKAKELIEKGEKYGYNVNFTLLLDAINGQNDIN